MSGQLLYNFGANADTLAAVTNHLQAINQVSEDIDKIFTVLGTVYEGAGADGLNRAHQTVISMLRELVNTSDDTQKMAQQQQDLMQDLDRRHAQSF